MAASFVPNRLRMSDALSRSWHLARWSLCANSGQAHSAAALRTCFLFGRPMQAQQPDGVIAFQTAEHQPCKRTFAMLAGFEPQGRGHSNLLLHRRERHRRARHHSGRRHVVPASSRFKEALHQLLVRLPGTRSACPALFRAPSPAQQRRHKQARKDPAHGGQGMSYQF